MNSRTMAPTTGTTWFQRGTMALAAVVIMAAISVGLVSMGQRGGASSAAALLGSSTTGPGTIARERYAALKLRQLEQAQAQTGSDAAPAPITARERYWAAKERELAQAK